MTVSEWIGRIGTIGLSLLVCLLVTEGAVRLMARFVTVYDLEMARYALDLKIASSNPQLGHVHRPSTSARLMGVQVDINSDGLRDREYAVQKPEGVRRVTVLGDSLTFGWGVASEDTFEAHLERRMNDRRPTEVLNFGTGNYNTEQAVALLLEKGLKYDPDDVLLCYFINDAEGTPAPSRWQVLAHSRALTFLWSGLRGVRALVGSGTSYDVVYRSLYRSDRVGWRRTRDAFDILKAAGERYDFGVKVVLLPDLHELVRYPFQREHTLMVAHLASLGVSSLDLAPYFRNVSEPRHLWVAADDAHPNARAHARIADHVLPFLEGS